jgi:hypothetical protein
MLVGCAQNGKLQFFNKLLRMGIGAVADGFFGEEGLLADAVGDFGEFALVGTDGGQVIGQADEIEGAEGFPDLFIPGIHSGDFGACGDVRTYGDRKRSNAAADGRAELGGFLAVLRGAR